MDRFAARSLLAKSLIKDAERHRRAAFSDLGADYETVEARLLKNPDGFDPLIGMALNFWHSWIDERNHGFPGYYNRIRKDSWPILAEQLSDSLEGRELKPMSATLRYFRVRQKFSLFMKLRRGLRRRSAAAKAA